jgi:hypothetical protein
VKEKQQLNGLHVKFFNIQTNPYTEKLEDPKVVINL